MPSAKKRFRHWPTVRRLQSISAAISMSVGRSGAPARKINRQRNTKACGVECARVRLCKRRFWSVVKTKERDKASGMVSILATRRKNIHGYQNDQNRVFCPDQETGQGFMKWTSSPKRKRGFRRRRICDKRQMTCI